MNQVIKIANPQSSLANWPNFSDWNFFGWPNHASQSTSSFKPIDTEIELKNPEAIAKFEIQFPEVCKYIHASKHIVKKYIPGARLSLEIKTDHDSETDFEELFLHIEVDSAFIKEAFASLRKINDELFSSISEDVLLFNIDIKAS